MNSISFCAQVVAVPVTVFEAEAAREVLVGGAVKEAELLTPIGITLA